MVCTCPKQAGNGASKESLAMQVGGLPRGRGRSKRMWMEVVELDLKKCNLSEDLAQDRPKWRNIIHVANPNIVRTRL